MSVPQMRTLAGELTRGSEAEWSGVERPDDATLRLVVGFSELVVDFALRSEQINTPPLTMIAIE